MSRADRGTAGGHGVRGGVVAASVVAACMLAAAAGLAAQPQATLPNDPGSDVVQTKCLGCHEADLIVQQRLARPGWVRELEKMQRWGAVLSDAEQNRAADYLATHFGPGRRAAAAGAVASADGVLDAGRATLERRCLGCHERDLIEQQRLDRAGWGRELDKMVRWGATVPAAERDALTTYLVSRFGPTR